MLWNGLWPGRDVRWGQGHQVLKGHGGDTVGPKPVETYLVSCPWCRRIDVCVMYM